MDLILDTDIIIEIFGGNEKILEHLRNYENKVFGITSVTEFDLFCVDLKEREVIMLDRLEARNFEFFRKYGLDVEISSGMPRRGQ